MKIKFSIITPSFNQAQFIEETLKSVLTQNYQPLEYFVMDGGSTDGSVKIIKKYAKKISWESKKDQGQAHAINKGLKKATGDIIAFINSDDYYISNSFQKVSDYFNSHPDCHWLVGDCEVTDTKLTWTFWLKQLVPYDRFPFLLLIFNFVNQPAVFLRRDLVKQVGLFDQNLRYVFDYDYWLRCLKVSPPHRLHTPLAVFRIHSGSKGNSAFKKQFTEDFQVIKRHTQSSIILGVHKLLGLLVVSTYSLLKAKKAS